MERMFTCSLFLLTLLAACQPKMDESATIIKLLEKESATWRTGDFKGHAGCWHIQPYSKILISTGDGTFLDIPPAAMIDPATKMGDGGSSSNSNYQFSIHADNAWVSHQEESIAKDGVKTYSYEIRMLEKVDGQWKLVGQTIHVYKP